MYSQNCSEDLSKYLHLLKPLRALADNWDIDLVGELTEFADIVDRMSQLHSSTTLDHNYDSNHPSQPDNANDINFAQAALLIQNSASIYSRKVQYLFNLTQETHSYIFNSNSAGNKFHQSRNKSAGEDEFDDAGGHEYRCLDDCLVQRDFLLASNDSQVTSGNQDIYFPHAQNTLLPEQSNMFTKPGELCRDRELYSVSMIGGLGNSSLNVESIGCCSEFELFSSMLSAKNGLPVSPFLSELVGSVDDYYDYTTSPAQSSCDLNNIVDTPDVDVDFNDNVSEVSFHEENEEVQIPYFQEQHMQPDDYAPQQQIASNKQHQQSAKKKEAAEFDFWKSLNAHQETGTRRPFKKGNVTRAFKLVQKAIDNRSKLDDSNDLILSHIDSIADFMTKNMAKSSSNDGSTVITNMKKLKFPELYQVYREESLQRAAFYKRLSNSTCIEESVDNEGSLIDIPEDFVDAGFDNAEEDVVSEQDDVALALPVDEAEFHQVSDYAADGKPINRTFQEMFSATGVVNDENKNAEYYGLATNDLNEAGLAKRVRQWEERLVPLLEEQRSRPEYDIERYRRKVQDLLRVKLNDHIQSSKAEECKVEVDNQVPFEELSNSVPQYEVSRYFLTLLHLANEGRIDIHAEPHPVDLRTHQLFVKLKS